MAITERQPQTGIMSKLRNLSRNTSCVRCKRDDGTIVGAHYTGCRRLSYGGGFGIKVDDWLTADLCRECHSYIDTLSRDKSKKWEHSEEFQHYILLTLLRRAKRGQVILA